MKKNRVFFLVLTLLLITSSITVGAYKFRDTTNHWSKVYVDELSSKNLINGYEDGSFRPNNNMTRVEFYKVVNQMAKYDKTYRVSFSDVDKSNWYYKDVAKGIKAGFIVPTMGKLNPNKPITREEVIAIIGKVYELPEKPGVVSKFTDRSNISKGAIGYAGVLVEQGVINGYPDGTLGPKNNITRGEVAKILSVIMGKQGMPANKYLSDSEIKFGPRELYE